MVCVLLKRCREPKPPAISSDNAWSVTNGVPEVYNRQHRADQAGNQPSPIHANCRADRDPSGNDHDKYAECDGDCMEDVFAAFRHDDLLLSWTAEGHNR